MKAATIIAAKVTHVICFRDFSTALLREQQQRKARAITPTLFALR
jgi:hypothetical protein